MGVGVAAGVGAGLTPWIFQLSRVAFDVSTFPFATALVLLAADVWARGGRRLALRSVGLGGALAVLTYAYPAGRLFGPLLAAALVVFARRVPWRSLVGRVARLRRVPGFRSPSTASRHPSGITARYHETAFPTGSMSLPVIVRHAFLNYVDDLNPWHWVVATASRTPTCGARRILFAVVVALAAVGVFEIVRHRRDRFWLYAIGAYLLSAVPASLTVDRHHALRLSAMPACVAVLAIPGLQADQKSSLGFFFVQTLATNVFAGLRTAPRRVYLSYSSGMTF